jgi:uncharacterized membrane protein YfcA
MMQASRNLLNAAMNATASLFFIFGNLIYWKQMAVLLVGAVIGGYLAGHYGRKLHPAKARIVIIGLNSVIVALVFWRQYG